MGANLVTEVHGDGGYGQWVRHWTLVALLSLAAALAGCGADDGPAAEREAKRVTLSLDFTPNAVHAPIYAAARDGRDTHEGVELEIRKPGPGPDALKLITAAACRAPRRASCAT